MYLDSGFYGDIVVVTGVSDSGVYGDIVVDIGVFRQDTLRLYRISASSFVCRL